MMNKLELESKFEKKQQQKINLIPLHFGEFYQTQQVLPLNGH